MRDSGWSPLSAAQWESVWDERWQRGRRLMALIIAGLVVVALFAGLLMFGMVPRTAGSYQALAVLQLGVAGMYYLKFARVDARLAAMLVVRGARHELMIVFTTWTGVFFGWVLALTLWSVLDPPLNPVWVGLGLIALAATERIYARWLARHGGLFSAPAEPIQRDEG